MIRLALFFLLLLSAQLSQAVAPGGVVEVQTGSDRLVLSVEVFDWEPEDQLEVRLVRLVVSSKDGTEVGMNLTPEMYDSFVMMRSGVGIATVSLEGTGDLFHHGLTFILEFQWKTGRLTKGFEVKPRTSIRSESKEDDLKMQSPGVSCSLRNPYVAC